MSIPLYGAATDLAERLASVINLAKTNQILQQDAILPNGANSALEAQMQAIIKSMALVDSQQNPLVYPQVSTTDPSGYAGGVSLAAALTMLQTQMIGSGTLNAPQYYIARPTVSITPTAESGQTWQLIFSTTGINGVQNDYVINESLNASVPATFATVGSTIPVGSELVQFKGQVSTANDPLDYGAVLHSTAPGVTVTMCDPTITSSTVGGNLLAVSGVNPTPPITQLNPAAGGCFQTDDTTANTPDGWLAFNVAPTAFGSSPYMSAAQGDWNGSNLSLTTLQGIYQILTVQPNTVYAVNFYAKTADTTGTLRIALFNPNSSIFTSTPPTPSGTTGVDPDAFGTLNKFDLAHGSATSSYAAYSAFFRTGPATTSVAVAIYLSTSASAAWNIADVGFCQATNLYGSAYINGPWCAAFRSSVDAIVNDNYQIAVANNWGTAAKFAQFLAQGCGLPQLGITIPSSTNSPATFAEALLTGA